MLRDLSNSSQKFPGPPRSSLKKLITSLKKCTPPGQPRSKSPKYSPSWVRRYPWCDRLDTLTLLISMNPGRRVATSPNMSRFLTNEGFNTMRINRTNDVSPNLQASTPSKPSFNRTLPTIMNIQIPEDNKPPQSITSRRKPSKPINTRMGVGKLGTALSRLAFECLRINSRLMRKD